MAREHSTHMETQGKMGLAALRAAGQSPKQLPKKEKRAKRHCVPLAEPEAASELRAPSLGLSRHGEMW